MINHPPAASTLKHEEPPAIATGTQTSIGVIDGATSQQSKSSANATTGGGASTAAPTAAAPTAATPAGPPGTPLTILEGSSGTRKS